MIIDTRAKFDKFIKTLEKHIMEREYVVVDTETSGLDMFGLKDRRKGIRNDGDLIEEEIAIGPARICGIAVGLPVGETIATYYLPFRHETGEKQLDPDLLVNFVAALEGAVVVNHNVKFDMKMFYAEGCPFEQSKIAVEDTMLLAHILDERLENYRLESLVNLYVGAQMEHKDMPKQYLKEHSLRRFSQIPINMLGEYAEDDARQTWNLYTTLETFMKDPHAPFFAVDEAGDGTLTYPLFRVFRNEMEALWVIYRMECKGIKINVERAKEMYDEFTVMIEETKLELERLAGRPLNVRSFKQLKAFWEERGWPIGIDALKDKETFQDMVMFKLLPQDPVTKAAQDHPKYPGLHEFISIIVKYRSLTKNRDTYLETYIKLADAEALLHPQFHQHGTVTGRLSSSQPNFQNVPKTIATGRTALQKAGEEILASPVRQIIIPRTPEHRFVSLDFGQQEVRLFLHYANEPTMTKIVQEGGDVHHYAAEKMFGGMPPKGTEEYKRRRHMAKFINFGIFYGMGARKLADFFDLTQDQAKVYYYGYLGAFPKIKSFIEEVRGIADERGFVRNYFGRRRRCRLLTAEERRTGKVKSRQTYTQSVRAEDRHADAHKMLNAIIQGGAADMVKHAMVRVDALLQGTRSYIVLQIHDEIVLEMHVDEREELLPKIVHAMTDWPQFRLPFTVDISESKWEWSSSEASTV